MDSIKKKRGENWTTEDKEVLRQLVAESANILENKSTKTNINNLKLKEWKNLTIKLNQITRKSRSESEIKLAWKRMKLAAKANLSLHKREQSQTGGGTKPPSPSPEDLKVMTIAPHDFVIEINDFDSDAVIPNSSESEPIPGTSSQVQPNIEQNQVIVINDTKGIKYVDHKQSEEAKVKSIPKITGIKRRKVLQNRNEEGCEAIINSNINFKKRQIEMLEVEHTYNIKISELKIKKLQLEIELFENQLKKLLKKTLYYRSFFINDDR